MSVVIYKLTRQGAMGLRFEASDGTSFFDPGGLKNPQLAAIVRNRLLAFVRCEVGNGVAEVLAEASPEEVAAYEERGTAHQESRDEPEGPFKFPGT